MKTKEELNALKEEVEILNNKLVKLNDEKLKQVSGGYLESFVRISNGEFPYIRFGKGNKNLVIIAGMSMTGLCF